MNRVRIRFGRGTELKFISHLDLTRLWHRSLRRAGIELAYSEGFNPHPHISLAVPLQIGVTSEAELMDVYTIRAMHPEDFAASVKPQIPAGLSLIQAFSVPLNIPALQAQVVFADYDVEVAVPNGFDVGRAISELLTRTSLPWCHERDTGTKSYDLRPLIVELSLAGYNPNVAEVKMRLRCGSNGTGRPEQVIKALGLDNPLSIRRTHLALDIRDART